MAKAIKAEDSGALQSISGALSKDAGGDKEVAALALKSAEALLKLNGEKDAVTLYFIAEAHFAGGDKAKAKEFAAKAIDSADSEGMKAQIGRLTKKYND